jgi:hypothetical protein
MGVGGTGLPVLPANESEAFSQFQQEILEVLNEAFFQFCFGGVVRFGYLEEFEYIGFPYEVAGFLYELSLFGQLEGALFVFGSGKT